MDPYLTGKCVSLGQPGRVDTSCPDINDPGLPYPSGIAMQGCCRADNTCGYMDDSWLGLGCVKPELFGLSSDIGCTY
jgi:hypothetical protein